jgi:spoIIIJ-associated protein
MTEETPRIDQIITSILTKMGFADFSVEKKEHHGRTVWNVSNADTLLSRHDTMRALGYIVQKILEKHGVKERLTIDVNNSQEAQVRDIENKAKILAERVRTFHSRAEMVPMNSYERMIVHSLFSDDSEITTISEGEGKERHVVLQYSGSGV